MIGPRDPLSIGAARYCSISDILMVPGTTGHFFASDACLCSASANSAMTQPKAPKATTSGDSLGLASRAQEFGQLIEADTPTEHDRQHDRGSDAEAAPQALRQIALQHRLVRMQRIVVDGDGRADRIVRDGLGDLEIAAVLADADAVVAQRLRRSTEYS